MAGGHYGAGTDVGLTREHNEDAYLVNDDLKLWVVADGMGGHEAGEVASAIAVQTVNAAVARGESLERAMNLAHKAVLKGSRKGGPGAAGMGCTCVAARLVNGDGFEVAWVGDSRAYHWSGDGLEQLSHDHSYVQTLVDLGVINEQEAIDHPDRSVLTQCLGSRSVDELEVGLVSGELKHGESLLLCSDGLTGEVEDARIAEIMGDSADEQVAVDRLIIAALEGGGSDNVTVVVVSSEPAPAGGNGSPGDGGKAREQPPTPTRTPDAATATATEVGNSPNDDAARAALREQRLRAAKAAGRGGAAAPGSQSAAAQSRLESERRAALGRQPATASLRKSARQHWFVKVLFMRISPSDGAHYLAHSLRLKRRALSARLAPTRARFALAGVYARRSVLALGVVLVSLGVAGGVMQA